jgi:hypothetical protein
MAGSGCKAQLSAGHDTCTVSQCAEHLQKKAVQNGPTQSREGSVEAPKRCCKLRTSQLLLDFLQGKQAAAQYPCKQAGRCTAAVSPTSNPWYIKYIFF